MHPHLCRCRVSGGPRLPRRIRRCSSRHVSKLRENFVRGVRLAWSASPRGFVGAASLAMGTALVSPVVIWLGKHLVDLVVEGRSSQLTVVDIMPTLVAFGVLGADDRALGNMQFHQQDVFARRVARPATKRFIANVAAVDLGHLDSSSWHDRMSRARSEVMWRPHQLTFATIGLASSAVGVAGMFGLLASLDPLLVAMSLISVAPWVAIQRSTNRKLYAFHAQFATEERERYYVTEVLSSIEMAKEVRSFDLADHFLARYARFTDAYDAKFRGLIRRANIIGALAALITGGGLAGTLSPGDLTAAIGGFAAVTSQASLLSSSLLQIEQHATFLDDLFELF